jgi:hypothetical protein
VTLLPLADHVNVAPAYRVTVDVFECVGDSEIRVARVHPDGGIDNFER